MGSVIKFLERERRSRKGKGIEGKGIEGKAQPATVIILPVVRIERFSEPSQLQPARGQSRRRRIKPSSKSTLPRRAG
ncbi:MAG TPA: hypothetical protein VH684_07055 [Xanthobacteraceae bacterium]|jgi:hypothetical protein